LGDLDGLLRRVGTAAGLEVDLVVDGDVSTVPAAVDLAAFRIVQESLTNVVRHASEHARATVRLERRPADLVVHVGDDGGQPHGKVVPEHAALGGSKADGRPENPRATVVRADGDGRAGDGTCERSMTSAERASVEPAGRVGRGQEVRAGSARGRGIAGMRERVHALGGTFAAGPRPGGGFGVDARFPLPPDGGQ
jgi:signal transduction histidine kinase